MVILPYKKWFPDSQNAKCKYKTYKLIYNKTIVSPTYSSSGRGEKKMACSHCKYKKITKYTIARLQESSTSSVQAHGVQAVVVVVDPGEAEAPAVVAQVVVGN